MVLTHEVHHADCREWCEHWVAGKGVCHRHCASNRELNIAEFRVGYAFMTKDGHVDYEKNVDEAELVSEKLRARIGPMQLSDLQDSIAAGRCFSWNLHASRAHQRILRRHMRYLAYHKPEHSVDVNQFRYAEGRGERQSRK